MELKAHFHRLENIKAIHDLDAAGLDHHVIAVFYLRKVFLLQLRR